MLSEKAKGKQRARDPPENPAGPSGQLSKPLVIRFTEGIPDLTIDVHPDQTVRDIKKNVCNL